MIGRHLKLQQLRSLRNEECTECVLHKSTHNVCIMGRGNVNALVHLVGEAPGEAEAKYGKPFMGLSGKELNKVLKELDMEDMVYISNLCRCRPPENRKPRVSEAQTCSNLYLIPEIHIIKPRILVLMGRPAIDRFLVSFARGQPTALFSHNFKGLWAIATWHPSYLLRTRTDPWVTREEFKVHLQKAKQLALNMAVV